MELFLTESLGKITIETDLAEQATGVIILAHGAGASMHHPFMSGLAGALADVGLHAVRFNFPYMEQGRKSPGSPKNNIATWELIVTHVSEQFPGLPLFLSGKSYGGRMASHLLADKNPDGVKGIIYFGFPLHAPGRDSMDRAAHLGEVTVPQLFLQGIRDKLANIGMMHEVVDKLPLATMKEIENGDHSFNVPKSDGRSKAEIISELAGLTRDFCLNV